MDHSKNVTNRCKVAHHNNPMFYLDLLCSTRLWILHLDFCSSFQHPRILHLENLLDFSNDWCQKKMSILSSVNCMGLIKKSIDHMHIWASEVCHVTKYPPGSLFLIHQRHEISPIWLKPCIIDHRTVWVSTSARAKSRTFVIVIRI